MALHRQARLRKLGVGLLALMLSLTAVAPAGAVVRGTVIEPSAFLPSGRYSWLVAVVNTSGPTLCTGMLIDPSWVLTAGHCLPADTVLSSSNDLRRVRRSAVDTTVSFTGDVPPDTPGLDAALIHLSEPLAKSPARLAGPDGQGDLPTGTVATVAGWGITPARSPFANEGTVRIVDAGFADLLFTVPAPGNPCSGDSGGPLLVNGVVVGIVNFGESQCNGITGYSRVSQLTSWIDSVLADSQTSTSAMSSSA
ncbi:MAG: hypothetical protein QOJ19_375 [Acidimicrobiia bacterium]|jgi:secreted trypsin-like serine protease|nr:hypothetical protein [Acidimicrobiia bacterium]